MTDQTCSDSSPDASATDRTASDAATAPEIERILTLLADPDARAVLAAAETPRTVKELAEECDVPLSTLYRKIHALAETPLLRESVRVGATGSHPTQYERDVGRITVDFGGGSDPPWVADRPREETPGPPPASSRLHVDGGRSLADIFVDVTGESTITETQETPIPGDRLLDDEGAAVSEAVRAAVTADELSEAIPDASSGEE